MSSDYFVLVGTVSTQGPEGVKGHWGLLEDVGGCFGASGVGGVRGVLWG